MTATQQPEPVYYSSEYRHGVDEKRRVQIPAKWRPSEPDVQLTLILWPRGSDQQACLMVLPPAEWQGLVGKLKAMPYAEPRAEALRRILGRRSDRVVLDKAGRICIPEAMAKAVGIEKEAVLVGLVDRFQIWNPERHALAVTMDDEQAGEAFKLI